MNEQISQTVVSAVATIAAAVILTGKTPASEMEAEMDRAIDVMQKACGVSPTAAGTVEDHRKFLLAACEWAVEQLKPSHP